MQRPSDRHRIVRLGSTTIHGTLIVQCRERRDDPLELGYPRLEIRPTRGRGARGGGTRVSIELCRLHDD